MSPVIKHSSYFSIHYKERRERPVFLCVFLSPILLLLPIWIGESLDYKEQETENFQKNQSGKGIY